MIRQGHMPGKGNLSCSLLSRQAGVLVLGFDRLTRHEEKEKLSCFFNWVSSPIPYSNLSMHREERNRETVLLQLFCSSFLKEDEEIFHAWSLTCRNTVIATYVKRPLTYSSSNWVSFFPSNVTASWPRRWKLTLQHHQVIENHLCQHGNKCLSTARSEDIPGLPRARVGGSEMRQGSSASQDKLGRSVKIKNQSQGLKLISSSLCCLQAVYPKGKMRYNWVVLGLCPVLGLLVSSSSFSLSLFHYFFLWSHWLYLNEVGLDHIKKFQCLYLSHTNFNITIP